MLRSAKSECGQEVAKSLQHHAGQDTLSVHALLGCACGYAIEWSCLEHMITFQAAAWHGLTMLLFKPFPGALKQARRRGHGSG
jgi:hypothetical protein